MLKKKFAELRGGSLQVSETPWRNCWCHRTRYCVFYSSSGQTPLSCSGRSTLSVLQFFGAIVRLWQVI